MSKGFVDLLPAFETLDDIQGVEDTYIAKPIEGRPSYRIAKDPTGNAAILIATGEAEDAYSLAPIELRNLSFRPQCVCRVTSQGNTDSIETLAVLKCTTEDIALREFFLLSLSGILASLPPNRPQCSKVSSAVSKLVELFRSLEEPPQASVQGLWSELFLIAHACDTRVAAEAWHAEPRALHDFSLGEHRVEVKSTISSRRIHEFLLDQLVSPLGTEVVVVSFILEESLSGLSIRDLWQNINSNGTLSTELCQRLLRVISLSLGRDWRDARRIAFDPDLALKQVRFYDTSAVPKIERPLQAEISDIRFKCDLSEVMPVSRSMLSKRGGLFASMFG